MGFANKRADPHRNGEMPHTIEFLFEAFATYDLMKNMLLGSIFLAYSKSHEYFSTPVLEIKGEGVEYGIKRAVEKATKLKEEGNEWVPSFLPPSFTLKISTCMTCMESACMEGQLTEEHTERMNGIGP